MKTIKIDGVTYEVINPATKKAQSILNSMKYAKSWSDLYDRPSQTKESIREYWSRTFDNMLADVVGYTGNCMTFSVFATSADFGFFYITKSHNYIIPCDLTIA